MDFLNALALFSNFVLVPALAYGAQLALGALGVTLIYAVLRFSNFAHGDLMAFGTMAMILVTWGLQSLGRLDRAAADRAARAALRHPRRRRPDARHRPLGLPLLPAPAQRRRRLRDGLGRGHVHLQRARPLRHRHRRAALRGRGAVHDPRQRLQGVDRARPGRRRPRQPGADPRRDGDHRHRAVLVPAEDPHRQGDARLFRQRGPRAPLGHQPRPGGDDHLDARGGAGDDRGHALRPRQVVPALHLLPAPAADLRRGDRRRASASRSGRSRAGSSSPSPR